MKQLPHRKDVDGNCLVSIFPGELSQPIRFVADRQPKDFAGPDLEPLCRGRDVKPVRMLRIPIAV